MTTTLSGLARASVLAFVAACGSDNGGDVVDAGAGMDRVEPDAGPSDDGGPPACAVQPTFTSIHSKILRDARCTVCHGTAPGLGSLFFAMDKTAAYTTATGNTVGGMPTRRVVAGDPDQSSFYLKFLRTPPFGSRMPQGGALPDCEIEAVRTWIANGAAND